MMNIVMLPLFHTEHPEEITKPETYTQCNPLLNQGPDSISSVIFRALTVHALCFAARGPEVLRECVFMRLTCMYL